MPTRLRLAAILAAVLAVTALGAWGLPRLVATGDGDPAAAVPALTCPSGHGSCAPSPASPSATVSGSAKLAPVPTPSARPSRSPTRAPAGDQVIAAAGDISCSGNCGQVATADLIRSVIKPAAVLGLGDFQYQRGTTEAFASYYDRSWGAFKSRTYAINGGSHDFYGTGDWLTYFNHGGPRRLVAEGSYSFDIGAWHIVALNSYCFERDTCDAAAVTAWLKRDLAAHPTACTLAYWHEPYWTTPTTVHNRDTSTRPWVQALYDAGADVLLQAHNHDYERFAPQRPDGTVDTRRGLTSFVVGTGGNSHYAFSGSPAANSLVRNNDTYGVLRLVLHPTSADFRFMPIRGKTFTDAGTIRCH